MEALEGTSDLMGSHQRGVTKDGCIQYERAGGRVAGGGRGLSDATDPQYVREELLADMRFTQMSSIDCMIVVFFFNWESTSSCYIVLFQNLCHREDNLT